MFVIHLRLILACAAAGVVTQNLGIIYGLHQLYWLIAVRDACQWHIGLKIFFFQEETSRCFYSVAGSSWK